MASNRLCSIDNCGKPNMARGWCKMHYARWLSHGDPTITLRRMSKDGEPAKFLAAVLTQAPTDECILWPFGLSNGYGAMEIDGKVTQVHRWICTRFHGEPPKGLPQAAHSCGKRACINERHLRWANQSQNEIDKRDHGTHNRGEQHPLSKLAEMDVRHIRILYGHYTKHQLAIMFEVHPATIMDVVERRRWDWLP